MSGYNIVCTPTTTVIIIITITTKTISSLEPAYGQLRVSFMSAYGQFRVSFR